MATVMISHRSNDNDVVERLRNDLSTAGHDVRLDTLDLHIGDSITAWMNANLRDAEYLVLCYSPSGIESPWMSREWLSTLARKLNGEAVQLLPVLLPGADKPPAILADLKYADLSRDWSDGVTDLLHAIK